MIFTRDCVTRENHWRITSLVTTQSLFTVGHTLFYISYMLDREYRVARLRYSRVLFTSEYQLCANLRVLAYLTIVNVRVSALLCGHRARVHLVVKSTEKYEVTPHRRDSTYFTIYLA